jgi:hypothetical protein
LLESKIERYLARVKTFSGDEIFIPYMDKELRLCNTEQQHFTPAVLEWASIAGLTPAEAFKELTYKVSSVQLSVTRLNALWEKYVDKINALTDREEMMNLVNSQLEMELRAGVQ